MQDWKPSERKLWEKSSPLESVTNGIILLALVALLLWVVIGAISAL